MMTMLTAIKNFVMVLVGILVATFWIAPKALVLKAYYWCKATLGAGLRWLGLKWALLKAFFTLKK